MADRDAGAAGRVERFVRLPMPSSRSRPRAGPCGHQGKREGQRFQHLRVARVKSVPLSALRAAPACEVIAPGSARRRRAPRRGRRACPPPRGRRRTPGRRACALDRRADRVEEDVARRGEVAADDDAARGLRTLTSIGERPRRPLRPRRRPRAGRRGRLPRPARAAPGRRQAGRCCARAAPRPRRGWRSSPGSRGCRSGRSVPCGSLEDVADLARDAERSVVRPAGEDKAGADARPTGGRRPGRRRRGRRRTAFSPSAPTLASFSSCTGMPSRASISAARPDAVPAGQDPVRLELAGALRLIGAARPMPTPSRRSRSMPAVLSASRTSSCGEVEALGRGVVDLGRRPVVDDRLAGEVADGDADVLVAEVEADRERGVGDEREQDRRAAGVARPRSSSGASCSSTMPAPPSSSTSVETVAARGRCAARAQPGWSPDGGRSSRSPAAGSAGEG